MIYDKVKITDLGNIDTGDKFYGVAVRDGRKWKHCIETSTPLLFANRAEAENYGTSLVARLKNNGLWKTK